MIAFGKRNENSIWFTSASDYKLMFRDHDSLYIALGHFRFRLMKLWRRNVTADLPELDQVKGVTH